MVNVALETLREKGIFLSKRKPNMLGFFISTLETTRNKSETTEPGEGVASGLNGEPF